MSFLIAHWNKLLQNVLPHRSLAKSGQCGFRRFLYCFANQVDDFHVIRVVEGVAELLHGDDVPSRWPCPFSRLRRCRLLGRPCLIHADRKVAA